MRRCAEGERLAERALAAARRQTDNHIVLAVLREWGQIEWNRGDRREAERRWAMMLDVLLPRTPREAGDSPPTRFPAVTPSQFEKAAQLARLAVSHEMDALALKAMRKTLASGAPSNLALMPTIPPAMGTLVVG